MNELGHFLSTSYYGKLYSSGTSALFEAQNINKDFLKREADATGDHERFQTARQAVQALWAQEDMSHQLNDKAGQKVLNFLYLMEIRQPGFTTVDKLHAIHDLYIGNTLDTKFLSAVNSDTMPDQAEQILAGATEHQVKSNKVYPDLTDDEEAIWNRVKVFHEFPDGFKWVYAVKADGSIASHIPSNITFKTMHHCGNTPDAHSNNQYWELRGPDGKAYLTVILSPEGKIEESKSWGNQPNKYRRMIQPYVKWFLKNKVSGVGYRYDYGYATHNNFGVKDFMGDDPEFIDYVLENKPELFGNTEKRIMFWKEALHQGVITVEDIKTMYKEGMTLRQVLGNFSSMVPYHHSSKFNEWGDIQSRRYSGYEEGSVFGSNPFDVVCAACDGCPFSKDELKQLIADKRVSLEEFANYDIHLLDDDMQKAFVAATSYNLNRLMNIAAEVGTFEIAPDIMTPLIGVLREGSPTPPPNYYKMDWSERHDNPACMKYDEDSNRFDEALRSVRTYMNDANPPEKARDVVDAVFGDERVMNNIFGPHWEGNSVNNYYYSRDVDQWLSVFGRFKDIAIPEVVMNYLSTYLFGDTRKSNSTLQYVIKIGRPRIDPLFEHRTPKEIANLCLDTSQHLKLDARNLLTTVKNLGDLVALFPEYSNIYSVLRPSLRLGYYCCAPEDVTNVPAAVEMAVAQIHKGEAIPNNPNAMLSATGAATMMAIGKFPEIMERATPVEVGDYVFPQTAMICHTWVDDGATLLSERLMNILKEAYMTYDERDKRSLAQRATELFMCAANRYDVIKEGDSIFNELYIRMAMRWPSSEVMENLTGYHFYPDIPADQWDMVTSSIRGPQNSPKYGEMVFIETYILPGLNNGKHADDPQFLDYLVNFLMEPEQTSTDMNRILRHDKFRKRGIMNKVKAAIVKRIEDGAEISTDKASTLNSAGILNKDFLVQAEMRRFDEQSNTDIDDSIIGRFDQMCNEATLKKFKKSRNFPYFVNELLRTNLEQYDMEYNRETGKDNPDLLEVDSISFVMFIRFMKIVDFLLSSPKTPTCIAAAKIARQSGLIDAYRMVAERFGVGEGKRPLVHVYYTPYNSGPRARDESTDLSEDFTSRIDKLDQLAQTRLKYKPEEGELPMKEK